MNKQKFKAMVHYVIARSDPSELGAIRLNKILWFADTFAYRAGGSSMTGAIYTKRQRGPVPHHIQGILRELEADGAIVIRERQRFDYTLREFIALTEPDVSTLSSREIGVIDDLREVICTNYTANSISELSHTQVWEAANMGEEIPMFAVLASASGAITPSVTDWADTVIEQAEAELQEAA